MLIPAGCAQSSEEQSNCGGGRGFPSTEGGGGDAAGRQQSSPETVCKGLEENPDNYESQAGISNK